MRKSIVLTLLGFVGIALSAFAHSGAPRQLAPPFVLSTRDHDALLHFRLTESIFRRVERVQQERRRRPDQSNTSDGIEGKDLIDTNLRNLRRDTALAASVRNAGLSELDYVLALDTLLMCCYLNPPPRNAADVNVDYLPRENVAFFIAHRARAMKLLRSNVE